MQLLGFQKVTLANGNYYSFSENKIWILRNEPSGKFIRNEEGFYEFELISDEEKLINLNLKYNSNFEVLVNNNKTELIKNDIFSKIKVEKGKNNVQIKYFPFDVLKGALIGILFLLIFILILKLIKFRVFN